MAWKNNSDWHITPLKENRRIKKTYASERKVKIAKIEWAENKIASKIDKIQYSWKWS